jgi:hypothetical protein
MTDTEKEAMAARLAELEQRLAELEATERADGLFEPLMRLFPPDARSHMRAARREQLLALRAILDRWIESLDRAPSERVRRRESISIE